MRQLLKVNTGCYFPASSGQLPSQPLDLYLYVGSALGENN